MINIQEIIPFMKDGWVAMDSDCEWNWYDEKPEIDKESSQWLLGDNGENYEMLNIPFDIAPADDWTKSLIKVGGKMRVLKIIPVTLERYNELVDNGEIDKTAFYTIVDDEELKQDE